MFNQSYGVHIMPLVINFLRGGITDTHTHCEQNIFLITRHMLATFAFSMVKIFCVFPFVHTLSVSCTTEEHDLTHFPELYTV